MCSTYIIQCTVKSNISEDSVHLGFFSSPISFLPLPHLSQHSVRLHLKCDGTCTETRFRLSAKRTSPFKTAGASVQLTTGSQGVGISCGNAGYTMFRGSVKGTGYPLHLPVSPSLTLPCVTVCHHISNGLNPSVLMLEFNVNCSVGEIIGHDICGWSILLGSVLMFSVLHFWYKVNLIEVKPLAV